MIINNVHNNRKNKNFKIVRNCAEKHIKLKLRSIILYNPVVFIFLLIFFLLRRIIIARAIIYFIFHISMLDFRFLSRRSEGVLSVGILQHLLQQRWRHTDGEREVRAHARRTLRHRKLRLSGLFGGRAVVLQPDVQRILPVPDPHDGSDPAPDRTVPEGPQLLPRSALHVCHW